MSRMHPEIAVRTASMGKRLSGAPTKRDAIAAVQARFAELRPLDDASFDALALALSIIGEVPRQVWHREDARRVVRKLVTAAERGSLDAAMLLLANDRADKPRGAVAFLRYHGLRVGRRWVADHIEGKAEAACIAA